MSDVGVDKSWEAESDARTLMESVGIRSDSKRLARAQKALTKLEKEAEKTKLENKTAKRLKKIDWGTET